MKLVDLMKLKKERKSQDVVPAKEKKLKGYEISKAACGSRPDDSYISNSGEVLDTSRGDSVSRGM